MLISATAFAADVAGNDWPGYFGGWSGWRYSSLSQINRGNVKKLKLAWVHQAGELTGGIQATPIVVNGVVYYVSAGNRVQAVDGASGKELWRYEPRLDPVTQQAMYGWYSRGISVAQGKVILASSDGRAIALDAVSGKESWSTQLTDFRNCQGCNFDSPPVVAGNVLTFGPTGGDFANAGKIYGVDVADGHLVWTFETIRNDEKSWPGNSGKIGGGGAWLTGTYDADTDTVFYGTANPAASFWGKDREGDNLYTSSVVALEGRTGKLRWYHQEVPHDSWDWDSIYEPLLIERDGRKLVVHLNKGGFVTVLDRKNGQVVNAWPLVDSINWASGIDPKTGAIIAPKPPAIGKETELCPAFWGARNWNHGAYSPRSGLWYNNIMNLCSKVLIDQPAPPDVHAYATGYAGLKNIDVYKIPGKSPAMLEAVDPVSGKLKWRKEFATPHMASLLATAGGLLFDEDPFGGIFAYDADTGKTLWSFNAGSGSRGGIVSYSINGRQYILVPVGWGGWFSILGAKVFPELTRINGAASVMAFTLED